MSTQAWRVRYLVPMEVIVTVTAADEDDAQDESFALAEEFLSTLAHSGRVRVFGSLDGIGAEEVSCDE